MLETIRKRLHRSKYGFTIHLHHITPWFMDDKTVVIAWKRGNKKNRRGQTQNKSPKKQPQNNNNSMLNIEESFDLDVTLYSESGSTRETGPYYPKELKLKVKELGNDKSVRGVTLGMVTIKLNAFADLLEHSLKLPLKCEKSVTTMNGPPELHLTLRSWLKKSNGVASTLSGLTSVGMNQPEDQSEEAEDPKCEISDFKDPVKILEVGKNSTIVVDQSKGLIVENAVHEEGMKSVKRPTDANQEVPVILTQNEGNTITLSVDSEQDRISRIDQNLIEKNEEVDAVIQLSSNKEEAESIVQDQDSILVSDTDDDLIKPSDSIDNIQEHMHSTKVTNNLNKTQTRNPQKIPTTKPVPLWFKCFSWIPGSQFICCQPTVPKEP